MRLDSAWTLTLVVVLASVGLGHGYEYQPVFDEGTLGVFDASRRNIPYYNILDPKKVVLRGYGTVYSFGDTILPGAVRGSLRDSEWTLSFWKRVGFTKGNDRGKKILIQFGDGISLAHINDHYDILVNKRSALDSASRLCAALRKTHEQEFGGWEYVALVRSLGIVALYINGVALSTSAIKSDVMAMPASVKQAHFMRFGTGRYYKLNIQGIIFTREMLSKSQVSRMLHVKIPEGTKLYEPRISTQGVARLSEYLPESEFNETLLFMRSPYPPVGEFPRILFSHGDLPAIHALLKSTQKGRFTLDRMEASINWIELETGEWFRAFDSGRTMDGQLEGYSESLLAYATAAWIFSETRPNFAHRIANITYWAIRSIRESKYALRTKKGGFNHDIVGRGYGIFLAFDLTARFMSPERVKECMNLFTELSKNAGWYKRNRVTSRLTQQQIEEANKHLLFMRGSNQDLWAHATICMVHILTAGWSTSDAMDIHQWSQYWQKMLRKVMTVNGLGVEPSGKEATGKVFLVALALKRLLPDTPNLLLHPQLYRWPESKVLQLMPHSPHINDLGTYSRDLIRAPPMLSVIRDNPFYAFATRFDDSLSEAYLPESQRSFGLKRPGTYGFMTNKADTDVHLAFTRDPQKPKSFVGIGVELGTFRIFSGLSAETTKPIVEVGIPFNLNITLLDEGSTMVRSAQSIFCLLAGGGQEILRFDVSKNRSDTEWAFFINRKVKFQTPRISNTWVNVVLSSQNGKSVLVKINEKSVGEWHWESPIGTELALVLGYGQYRANPSAQNRAVRTSFREIKATRSGETLLDVSGFDPNTLGLDFSRKVHFIDLYQFRESKDILPPLKPGESPVDKRVLAEVVPNLSLELSDSDIGVFAARASWSPESTYTHFFASNQGHGKKSGGHVDIGGIGILWVTPPRRLAPQPEEYMTILVDGRPPPGENGAMFGSYIGAKRSTMGSGAAIDLTLAYRNRGIVFRDKGRHYTADEAKLSPESIDVRYAYRSVAFLRGREDRGVILVLDNVKVRDNDVHTFDLSVAIHRDDKVIAHRSLTGDDGAYEYTVESNRTRWMNENPASDNGPRQWYHQNSATKHLYVKSLQGSEDRRPVSLESCEMFGSSDYHQGYESKLTYEPDMTHDTHVATQVCLTVTSEQADFITAYYPHLPGEALPDIRWNNGTIHVTIDEELTHVVELRDSPFTNRKILALRDHWSLDP